MPTAYADDLAYIHDTGFGEFARQSAGGLLEIFQQKGIHSGRVVDLGCGSGIWARELVDAGYEVTGIDISPAMIALSRKRVRQGDFRVGSCLTHRLPRCSAVTALGEVLNYRFDSRAGLDALRRLFGRVHTALLPGGLFIFDIAEPGRNRTSGQRFWETDEWTILVDYEYDRPTQQLSRHIVTFRKTGKSYRRHAETHKLQLYRRGEIAAALREAGFSVNSVRQYGEFRFPEGWIGFVARKRGALPNA